jgi:hypothetical protein
MFYSYGMCPTPGSIVHRRFANRPLLRRVTALMAAYAITLSGLFASVSAVRAAVADATAADIVICHTPLGQPAPAGDHGDCSSSCCIGCLMLLAGVPPPPMASVAVVQSSGRPIAPPAVINIASRRQTKSHRSRAPPFAV